MKQLLKKSLKSFFRGLKTLIKSNATIRSLLLDLDNVDEFSNLYEHEMMVADPTRVNTYHEAISRIIKADDVVLDLGTGTGILSFFAAKQSPKRIYALDHSNFIEVAKKIADHNDTKNVEFVNENSRNFDPGEKLDVILHEQIGDELFDENMIENILDLKKRLLKEGGRILPAKFEFFVEPVCFKKEYKIPYIWENEVLGVDFSFLRDSDLVAPYKKDYYEKRYRDSAAFDCFLCEPESVMSFDLEKLESADDLPSLINVSKAIANNGSLDGFCLYFRVIFDEGLDFDTSPFSTHTHWSNQVFRTKGRDYVGGDMIEYTINIGNLTNTDTWSIDITNS